MVEAPDPSSAIAPAHRHSKEVGASKPVDLRSLAASAFLPAMIYEIGTGAVLPIVVTTATDLGASTGMAAFALALLSIGRVIGDIPAAAIAERVGDRHAMILAAAVAFCGFFACMVAPSLLAFCIAIALTGVTSATFYLARQAYLIEVAPVRLRARAMSTLAGSHRVGLFIGPFAGALAITIGGVHAAYLVAMLTAIVTAAVLFFVPDIDVTTAQTPRVRGRNGVTSFIRNHHHLFLTLGLAIAGVGAVRQVRQLALPLWAQHIGLGPTQVSLVFGAAGAVEMVLFYPSGRMMDRWGRLAVALPAMIIMGLGMLALPLTHSVAALALIAMTISLGNGIGSGIIQTLGADAAPTAARRRFLGVWRFFGDSGQALGPVALAAITGLVPLAGGIMILGVFSLGIAGALAGSVPNYSAYATPHSMRLFRANHD